MGGLIQEGKGRGQFREGARREDNIGEGYVIWVRYVTWVSVGGTCNMGDCGERIVRFGLWVAGGGVRGVGVLDYGGCED